MDSKNWSSSERALVRAPCDASGAGFFGLFRSARISAASARNSSSVSPWRRPTHLAGKPSSNAISARTLAERSFSSSILASSASRLAFSISESCASSRSFSLRRSRSASLFALARAARIRATSSGLVPSVAAVSVVVDSVAVSVASGATSTVSVVFVSQRLRVLLSRSSHS